MDKWVVDPETGAGSAVPMTPAEEAQYAADQQQHALRELAETQAGADDSERLALVAERAETDPAYAALAELSLRGVSRGG